MRAVPALDDPLTTVARAGPADRVTGGSRRLGPFQRETLIIPLTAPLFRAASGPEPLAPSRAIAAIARHCCRRAPLPGSGARAGRPGKTNRQARPRPTKSGYCAPAGGSVTKPMRASPACCAAPITCAITS